MKNLKTILLITSCLICVNAFEQNGSRMNAPQRTDYIIQHVSDMSPDQKSKLAEIENEYLSEIRSVDNNRVDSLRQATDGKIQRILSNTQYEQYKAINPYSSGK